MTHSTDLHWQAFGGMHYTLRELAKLDRKEPIGHLLDTVKFALTMVEKAEAAKVAERQRELEEVK